MSDMPFTDQDFEFHTEGAATRAKCRHCGSVIDSSAIANHQCASPVTYGSGTTELTAETTTATSASSTDAAAPDSSAVAVDFSK
jgi:hypothetical protein